MLPSLRSGDLVVGIAATQVRPGDVILFREPHQGFYVIHRVLEVTGSRIITRGDNNPPSLTETVAADRVYARVILRLPRLGHGVGWIKKHLIGAKHGRS